MTAPPAPSRRAPRAGAGIALGAAGLLALAGCSGLPDCTAPTAQALAIDIMGKTTTNKLLTTLIYADRRAFVAERMEQFSPDMLEHLRELCDREGLVIEGSFTKGEGESAARCKVRVGQQFRDGISRTTARLAIEYPETAEAIKDIDGLLAAFQHKLAAAWQAIGYSLADVRATGTIPEYGISSCAATLSLAFGDFGSTSLPVEYDVQTGPDGKLRGAVYGAVEPD